MIILIKGFGKTFFCRELFKSIGRHQLFSFNDSATTEQLELIVRNLNKVNYPVVVITGSDSLIDHAETEFRKHHASRAIVHMTLEEPIL
tara:strand:+ start:868 stop:1134 length:267 start_codon:yes stop_codon:yes gene_type:complete